MKKTAKKAADKAADKAAGKTRSARSSRSSRSSDDVVITHPEKVLFPDEGMTKGELAAYYDRIAPLMIPHIAGRPITMERFPAGIGEKGFLQKNVVKGFPAWLRRVDAPKKDGIVHYPIADDARSLRWLANQNTITLHVWPSRVPRIFRPDIFVVDLDPSKEDPEALRTAALAVRDVFAELGFMSWVKTSGSKGFHIVTPLADGATFQDSAALGDRVTTLLMARAPELFTLEFSKADRQGRILLDIGRNRPGATFAAVYTVRAKPGAPVSAPCTWEEIENGGVHPQSFTLRMMDERIERVGDLWSGLVDQRPRGAR